MEILWPLPFRFVSVRVTFLITVTNCVTNKCGQAAQEAGLLPFVFKWDGIHQGEKILVTGV